MDFKKVSFALLTASTLVACGAQDNNEAGQQGLNNIDPVRNESRLDGPLTNRNVQNGQYGNLTTNRGTTYDGTYQRGYDLTADNTRQNNYPDQNNTSRQNNMNGNQTKGNNEYQVADRAADRISDQIQGVENVYVVTNGNNAYVAAELNRRNGNGPNNEDKLSEDMKRQIAKVVKAETNNIDYVYVSTNPDFVNFTTDYANDVENGEPIEGLFEEFGDMVERVFPQQAD